MRTRANGLIIGNQCNMLEIYVVFCIYSRYSQFKKRQEWK
jgi:hypothetical protein